MKLIADKKDTYDSHSSSRKNPFEKEQEQLIDIYYKLYPDTSKLKLLDIAEELFKER